MLETLGLRLVTYLYDAVLPEVYNALDEFADYLARWRDLLEGEA